MDSLAVKNWLTTMDWVALAALLSAIGTLIIAIITFVNVRILRRQISLVERQTNLVEKQTIIQRSGIYPFLEWDTVRIQKNTVRIMLANKGKGPALNIGLVTMFHHCKFPNGQVSDRNFLYEFEVKRKVYPSGVVSIMRGPREKSTLHPQDTAEFHGEIMFRYSPFTSPAEYPWRDIIKGERVYLHKDYTFDELNALMAANKRQFIAVFIHICYKDISEQIVEIEPLYRVIVDFHKHNNMQEAIKDGMAPRLVQMSFEEIPRFSWDDYKNMKSRRVSLEDFQRFQQ